MAELFYIHRGEDLVIPALEPGMRVFLERGGVWDIGSNQKVVLEGGGTEADPALISDFGEGPRPVLKIVEPYNSAIIHDEDQAPLAHVIIENLVITGEGVDVNTQAVKLTHCSYIELRNLLIKHIQRGDERWCAGLVVRNADHIAVRHCSFVKISGEGVYIGNAFGKPGDGPVSVTLEWNTFYECDGEAINTKPCARRCQIAFNDIYRCARVLDNSAVTLSGHDHVFNNNTVVGSIIAARVGTWNEYDPEGHIHVVCNRIIGAAESFRIASGANVFRGNSFLDVDVTHNVIAERYRHIIEDS